MIQRHTISAFVVSLLLLCVNPRLSAQLYGKVSAGYSFGFPTSYLGTGPDDARVGVYDALADGTTISAGAGYMFTPSIGAELQLFYLMGRATDEFGYMGLGMRETFTLSLSALAPCIVLSLPLSSGIKMYSRIGPYIVFPALEFDMYDHQGFIHFDENGYPVRVYEEHGAYKGNSAWGYYSSVGIGIDIDGSAVFTTDVAFANASWAPDRFVDDSGITQVVYRDQLELPNDRFIQRRSRFGLGSISVRAGLQMHF